MINVLVNAYAVSPNWGSEPGLGWNWVINLANYCNVYVITEGEYRDKIEKVLKELPQKDRIHFYFNPVPDEVRKMCWNQGDWRFYKHYRIWQKKSLAIAKKIVAENKIDVIHQLNMIGYREPGALWKLDNIPFVWGPVGAYGWTTMKFLNGQSIGTKLKAAIKNILNAIQGRYYPLSNNAMRKAAAVLAANSNVYSYIKKHHRKDVILMNETGCYEKEIPISIQPAKDNFDLLWVGKFVYRKQLELAIRTIAILRDEFPHIILNIVGDKNNSEYIRLAKLSETLHLQNNIKWLGLIPNEKVHELMQKSDAFFFTSIDEGTPHVVLEAIQNNLPVICFDTCGQGDVVNENVGIKIPLTNFTDSQNLFAEAISTLIKNPDFLNQLRENCSKRQKELSWDNKIREMIGIYKGAIAKYPVKLKQ